MITNTVHFISMRTKTAWGNTLSLHRERQGAVCPFVYAAAFGHFLPATSAAAAVSRGRRFLQEEAAEPGGRQHRRIEADIARGMILQKYGVQKQAHAAVRVCISISRMHDRFFFHLVSLSLTVQLKLVHHAIMMFLQQKKHKQHEMTKAHISDSVVYISEAPEWPNTQTDESRLTFNWSTGSKTDHDHVL